MMFLGCGGISKLLKMSYMSSWMSSADNVEKETVAYETFVILEFEVSLPRSTAPQSESGFWDYQILTFAIDPVLRSMLVSVRYRSHCRN